MNYKMAKKNFLHIHVFQNLFTVNMILILAVIILVPLLASFLVFFCKWKYGQSSCNCNLIFLQVNPRKILDVEHTWPRR